MYLNSMSFETLFYSSTKKKKKQKKLFPIIFPSFRTAFRIMFSISLCIPLTSSSDHFNKMKIYFKMIIFWIKFFFYSSVVKLYNASHIYVLFVRIMLYVLNVQHIDQRPMDKRMNILVNRIRKELVNEHWP